MDEKNYPEFDHLIFRIHALRQMFKRRISDTEIRAILADGVIIENYPGDTPYPGCLVSGMTMIARSMSSWHTIM